MIRRLPIALLVLGIAADAATTHVCISTVPGCVEGNPVSASLFVLIPGGMWVVATLMAAAVVGAGWPLWTRRPLTRATVVIVWVLMLLVALQRWDAVVGNAQLIFSA